MTAKERWLKHSALEEIRAWVNSGLSKKEIADKMGIAHSTLYKWLQQHDELACIFNDGLTCKNGVDATAGKNDASLKLKAEHALEKLAFGHTVCDVTRIISNGEVTSEKMVEKQISPNYSALSLWLKKNCPEKWGDENNKNGQNEIPVVIIENV